MEPTPTITKRYPYQKLIWIFVMLLSALTIYSYERVVYAVFPVLPIRLQLSIATHIVPDSTVSVLPIVDRFRTSDSVERKVFFKHLLALKSHSAIAVPILIDDISASRCLKNDQIFWICSNAGPSAHKYLKPFILGPSDDKADFALAAISEISRESKGDIDEIIPEIFQLLKSSNERRTQWIPHMLEPTRGRYVTRLLRTLNDKSSRSTAMYSLGRLGPDARDAVPALATDLINKDPESSTIATVLANIGVKTELVVEALIVALDNKEARLSAVDAGRRLIIRDKAFLVKVKAFTLSKDVQLAKESKRLMKLYGNEHF